LTRIDARRRVPKKGLALALEYLSFPGFEGRKQWKT